VTSDILPSRWGWRVLALALLVTALVYWPGLRGGWLFDDYPNIVDNHGVQPATGDLAALVKAVLSSPASDFKRPLASLSFAANYLVSGLDPFPMKLTNLVIHLWNGVLVFLLIRALFRNASPSSPPERTELVAAICAASWLLLPINLTSVLYVVQRMESMANLFVLIGLIGYVHGRERLLSGRRQRSAFAWCTASLVIPTAVGALAKETAVMLPLYACLLEWLLFGFRHERDGKTDRRIVGLFAAVLFLPLTIGLAWLIPSVLRPQSWASREFTLSTRLLTEGRVVLDYAIWTLFPRPSELSFYHDDYVISTGWLSPWTTLGSITALAVLASTVFLLRKRRPLIALGVAWFLGCQLLTATILPLELVYEHRNYFASLGLILAVVPTLMPPGPRERAHSHIAKWFRGAVLCAFLLWWAGVTAMTAYSWGDPLDLARELADRGAASPRAQYELGRTNIIYSHYVPSSPYTRDAYAPLERAAALPRSSILPQQALIFMNARMGLPTKDAWWDSMVAKLKSRQPGVQDESSLIALSQCMQDKGCDLPQARMTQAFAAAVSHPNPTARLLAAYGDYAWNVKGDRNLGEQMQQLAVQAAPREVAYRITFIRMLVAQQQFGEAQQQLKALEALNVGGYLDESLRQLQATFPTTDPR
jgi:hypothetical protein